MELKKNIQQHIYPHRRGIMGTVIFHLLLAILLLSMEISRVRIPEKIEIVVDMPEPEEVEQKLEEEQKKEEIRQKSSAEEVDRMLRAIAVNEDVVDKKKSREASVQQYIDEVMNELESEDNTDGKRYKARRDKNYRQDSLLHMNDRREKTLDSLKSTFYAGESSVSYSLKGRYAKILPIPVFKCEFGGKVVVTILVNRRGIVQKAVIVEAESKPDDCLWRVAVDAAERSRFNEKHDAPEIQRGTITYNFVKQ